MQTLGIDIGAWISGVIAFGGAASGEIAGGVPVLDPGPLASLLALTVAAGLMWRAHRSIVATRGA